MPCYAVFLLETDSRVLVEDLFDLLQKTADFLEKSQDARAVPIRAALKMRTDFEDGEVDWNDILPFGQSITDYISQREKLPKDLSMDVSFHFAENEEAAMFEAFNHWSREYEIAGNPHIHLEDSPTPTKH